jgi:hypothetical protein
LLEFLLPSPSIRILATWHRQSSALCTKTLQTRFSLQCFQMNARERNPQTSFNASNPSSRPTNLLDYRSHEPPISLYAKKIEVRPSLSPFAGRPRHLALSHPRARWRIRQKVTESEKIPFKNGKACSNCEQSIELNLSISKLGHPWMLWAGRSLIWEDVSRT